MRVLESRGVDGLSLKAVAAELNIQSPSLYNYVSGIAGLKSLCAQWGWARLADSVNPTLRHKSSRTRLKALANRYRAFALANPNLYQLMNGRMAEELSAQEAAQRQQILMAFEARLDDLPARQRIHMLRSLRAAIHGFVMLESAAQFQMHEDTDASFEYMIDSILKEMSPD